MNIEYCSKEKIREIQTVLLRQTIQYVNMHSPYYRGILCRANLNLETFNLSDLEKLPVISKEDLLRHNEEFFCSSIACWSDIVTTSGSTGVHPIVHPLTYSDLMRLTYNEKVSFMLPPITKNDQVMLAIALDGSFVAGLAYYLGLRRLGITVIRAGSKNLNLQLEILGEFSINAIVGVPSNLIKLYNYAASNGKEQLMSKIDKLILIGESIREKNFILNQLGRRLSNCFPNAKLYSTYANTETCVSFCECEKRNGGHLHPDLAYIEILDNNNNIAKVGDVGRLVITTFGSQSMPLVRYDTGDLTYITDEPCECGRNSLRIGPILGRHKNIFKVGGVTVSQQQLENVILSLPYIIDYCIIIENDNNGVAFATVWITPEYENTGIKEEIRIKVWESVRISIRVNCCTLEQLGNMQNSTGSRKPIRFINFTDREKI